ncbi:unnamed protein product [Ceratitis capitata]|uniref:(Mediterranean fruit fly) hypothetical protein n=1 Tax=Ceratitis capitata TaxID=7213 RepID=A0A811VIX4_CERCA|nr:unnamed protein product [Ceratitis capitata]
MSSLSASGEIDAGDEDDMKAGHGDMSAQLMLPRRNHPQHTRHIRHPQITQCRSVCTSKRSSSSKCKNSSNSNNVTWTISLGWRQRARRDGQDRLNDADSVVNGSCASSEDLNQTNSSEQGEKITSGSDDEAQDDNLLEEKTSSQSHHFHTYQLHELERAFEKSHYRMSIRAKS